MFPVEDDVFRPALFFRLNHMSRRIGQMTDDQIDIEEGGKRAAPR